MPRYATALRRCRATACLLRERDLALLPAPSPRSVVDEPQQRHDAGDGASFSRCAAARIALPASGVSPGAVVDPRARLEPGVIVDPGAVIGPGAEIGAGTSSARRR